MREKVLNKPKGSLQRIQALTHVQQLGMAVVLLAVVVGVVVLVKQSNKDGAGLTTGFNLRANRDKHIPLIPLTAGIAPAATNTKTADSLEIEKAETAIISNEL